MTALDLAADVGLLAVFLAATNICVGLLIAVRYSPRRRWPHRRVNIFAVHTWTAYFLMTSLLVHPIILLFSRKIRWRLLDLVVPIWSPVQPIQNTIGAVSLPDCSSSRDLILSSSAWAPPLEIVPLPRVCSGGWYVHSRHPCGPQLEGKCNRSARRRKAIY